MRFLLPLLLAASVARAGETCKLPCGTPERVHAGLVASGEQVAERGVTGGGALLTFYTARDGSTFTVVLTTPKGGACVLSAGVAWEAVVQGQRL